MTDLLAASILLIPSHLFGLVRTHHGNIVCVPTVLVYSNILHQSYRQKPSPIETKFSDLIVTKRKDRNPFSLWDHRIDWDSVPNELQFGVAKNHFIESCHISFNTCVQVFTLTGLTYLAHPQCGLKDLLLLQIDFCIPRLYAHTVCKCKSVLSVLKCHVAFQQSSVAHTLWIGGYLCWCIEP